jgi:hypothetical protein
LVDTIIRVGFPSIGVRVAFSSSNQSWVVDISNTSIDGLVSVVGSGVEEFTSADTLFCKSAQLGRAVRVEVAEVSSLGSGVARKVISSGSQIDDGGDLTLIGILNVPSLVKSSTISNGNGTITVSSKNNSGISS